MSPEATDQATVVQEEASQQTQTTFTAVTIPGPMISDIFGHEYYEGLKWPFLGLHLTEGVRYSPTSITFRVQEKENWGLLHARRKSECVGVNNMESDHFHFDDHRIHFPWHKGYHSVNEL